MSTSYPQLKSLSGVILAGGRGSRLGGFKPLQPFNSQPLILHITNKLKPFFGELLVITDNPLKFAALKTELSDIRIIKDLKFSGDTEKSPLLGIYTALNQITYDYALVVACDMPFLNLELLNFMAGKTATNKVIIPVIRGYLEPLHAFYPKKSGEIILSAIKNKQFKLSEVIKSLEIIKVEEDEISKFDPNFLSTFNINKLQDLETAEKILYYGKL